MKRGDGGFRPADPVLCEPKNRVQFATDGASRMIVSVDVANSGNDHGAMAPMHDDVCQRYDTTPDKYLVDGGFHTKDDITALEQRGTPVFAPLHGEAKMIEKGTDPHARQKTDTDEMAAFRQRLATDDAKQLYKQRPSIAEFPNAECHHRGLHQFRVCGLKQAKATTLWYAPTFNLMRLLNLGWVT